MKKVTLRQLCAAGIIAAAYCTVSLTFAPVSFGLLQFRIAEILSLMPVLGVSAVWGVTVGCAVTNAVGASMGANILGMADAFIGSAATLAAAVISRRWGRHRKAGLPILAGIPPVLINAAVIGGELCWSATGSLRADTFLLFAAQIAFEQLIPCMLLGPLLIKTLEKRGLDRLIP